ncbi:DUF4236 domain-containing protein [Clostridium senegalense]
MGLNFRKSIKVGPCRVNLSKSGISASTGVKGARVGVGKRGVSTSVGANGVYYRKTYGSKKKGSKQEYIEEQEEERTLVQTAQENDAEMREKSKEWLKEYGLKPNDECRKKLNVKMNLMGIFGFLFIVIGLAVIPLFFLGLYLSIRSIYIAFTYKRQLIKATMIYEAKREANKEEIEAKEKYDKELHEKWDRDRQEKKEKKQQKEKDKIYKDVNKYLDRHNINRVDIDKQIEVKEIE